MNMPLPDKPPPAPQKRAEWLVSMIEDRVERERLLPGTSLGTETQLMARYEVSRETLRKAVRQLERHGVAVMRRGGGGGGGGLTVAALASQTAINAITAHLEFADTGWDEIVEARSLIDVQSAILASSRIDAAGIARLRQLSAELDRGPGTVRDIARRQIALPSAIAEISGNPVVHLFSVALNNWSADILPSELGSPALRDRETHRVNDILREITEAIIAGNAEAARQAVEAFSARSLKVCRVLEERRQRSSADDWLRTGTEGEGKLAQRLALALAREVAMRDWPIERFGDEASLIERFNVSRAVLREAIRMLELHGIARPQRGRGGGLMIGRPNADYTVTSAKRYLRRAGLGTSDYLSVRDTLERGTLDFVIKRASDVELLQLAQLNERIQRADDSQITALAIAWHDRFSELSQNRALSLLLRTLFTLTEEAQPRLPPDIAQTLRKRHAQLTVALNARDRVRAQRITHEHVVWLQQVLERGLAVLGRQERQNASPE